MAVRQADNKKPFIDIRGPAGNAHNVLGQAKDISKQLGHSESQIEAIQNEMMLGDYENLIAVFDKHYGSLVDIVQ